MKQDNNTVSYASSAPPIDIERSWNLPASPCFYPHSSSLDFLPLSISAPPVVVRSPCAACKILRRRCTNECVLAPYFPPTEPLKFVVVHKIFGAGNIIKFLQELPEHRRADAASSLVYEANARIRDPVYGCAGAVFHLQNQLSELHAQLAIAKAELHNMQLHQANLLNLISAETTQFQCQEDPTSHQQHFPFTSLIPHNKSSWNLSSS